MRELRHDFRHYYRVAYDDVPTGEAIDLIETLPDGSLYAAATDFLRSWGPEQNRHADMLDAIHELTWALAIDHESMPEPPKVVRPKDVMARVESFAAAKRARSVLESGDWEEM